MTRVLELDQMRNLASQLATLKNILDRLDRLNFNFFQTNVVCKNYAGEHDMAKCPLYGVSNFKQATYVENLNRHNNPYSNTYNPGWRNFSKFFLEKQPRSDTKTTTICPAQE